jgi:hypothetical protein
MYGFGALAVPRIFAEMRTFGREVPKNLKIVEDELIPKWEEKLRGFAGGISPPAASSGTVPSITGPEGPRILPPGGADGVRVLPLEPEEWKPAVRITPRDDGSFDLDVGSGVEIRPMEGGGYRLEEVERKKKHGIDARLLSYIERNYLALARGGFELVSNVARGVFLFFMTLMLAAYLMLTRERIIGFFRGLVRKPARRDFDRLLTRIDQGLAGVVRGQLLICLVNGILTAIGFAFIGLKYWPVLALIGGIGSLIPIFGSIISSVPAVAIGLTQSPGTALLVLAWIVFIHQVEANYLNPKIIGIQAHLHPVLIIFVLLAGAHFFQATGALLAVPCLSIAQSLFLHFREVADRDELDFSG